MKTSRPTSALLVAALLAIGLAAGRLLPPLIVRLGGTPPRLGWAAPITLLGGAVIVGVFAWNTWQSLHRRRERMTAQYGLTMLSLARAVIVVGALVAGVYGGYALAYLDTLDSTLGQERFVRGLAAAGSSLLLLVAGLLLERACKLPEDDDPDADGSLPSR